MKISKKCLQYLLDGAILYLQSKMIAWDAAPTAAYIQKRGKAMKNVVMSTPRIGTYCKVCGKPINREADYIRIVTPRQQNGAFLHAACVWADGKQGKAFDVADVDAPAAPALKGRESDVVAFTLTARLDGAPDEHGAEVLAADYRAKVVKAPSKRYAVQYPTRYNLHGIKDLIDSAALAGKVVDWTITVERGKVNPDTVRALAAAQKSPIAFGKNWQYQENGTAATVTITSTTVTVRRIASENTAHAFMLIDAVLVTAASKKPARNAEKAVERHLQGEAGYQKAKRNK